MIRSSADDHANKADSSADEAAPSATPETGHGSVPAATADTDVSSTVYLVPAELISVTPPPLPLAKAGAKAAPSSPPPLRKSTVPAATPPLPSPPPFARRPRPRLPSGEYAAPAGVPEAETDTSSLGQILADAKRRVSFLPKADKARLARAHLECGLLFETQLGDTTAALEEYTAAERANPGFLPAAAAVRRLLPHKPLSPYLAQLEAEIRATTHPARRAARLFELGRREIAGDAALAETARAHLSEVLEAFPRHPGALRALESALRQPSPTVNTAITQSALAEHLGTMADHFRADPALGAWLHVERGRVLVALDQPQAATLAFEAALALDGRIGPVRSAYTEHLAREGRTATLADAWVAEADLEQDRARAARLCYLAGRLCAEKLDQKSRAAALFERAQGHSGAEPFTRKAALRELVDLYARETPARIAAMQTLLTVADEPEIPYWHRRLAEAFLELGKHTDVAEHARHALYHAPADESLREMLDQSLAALGQHDERFAMFTDLSGRESVPAHRIRLLLRAADIALRDMGRPDQALISLRAVLAIDPENTDASDGIARLLTPDTPAASPTPGDPSHVLSRIDFLAEAAATAKDPARKVAHLEALARIWEDEVRDPAQAVAVWEKVLAVEPHRRGALIGLGRAAGRAGDFRAVVHALATEAADTPDAELAYSLRLRAATLSFERLGDHTAALDLLAKATAHNHADPAALRLRFRIHDQAGHIGEALAQLRHLYDLRRKEGAGFSLLVEIARYTEEKLQKPVDALGAFREAHALAPADPLPREEARRILRDRGDAASLAEEYVRLAAATTQPAIKGELLFHAAQILDDQTAQADRALALYTEARASLPDEPLLLDRLDHAYVCRGLTDDRLGLVEARAAAMPSLRFAAARLRVEHREPHAAFAHLAPFARDPVAGVAALRTLEHALRTANRWDELATVLRAQMATFTTREAQLGSLHELVALEEFHAAAVPDGCPPAAELLASYDPGDPFVHERMVRNTGLAGHSPEALAASIPALRALAAAEEPSASAYYHLACGLLVDRAAEGDPALRAEALRCYQEATRQWPDSLAAARAGRRLALAVGDRGAFLRACLALGEHELDGKARSLRLLDAAQATLATGGPAATAMDLVCRALATDPNSGRAADGVLSAIAHGMDVGKAVELLRTALDATKVPEQAVKLGAALAHVAAHQLHDHTVAIEALRRARRHAPNHPGTLLSLAEVSLSLGLYAEAVEAAAAGMAHTHEPALRLRGLITLADVHTRTPAFRDAARREALEAASLADHADPSTAPALAHLGAVLRTLGEADKAGPVLVRAAVLSEDDHTALDHLLALGSSDPELTARHLAQVLALAAQQGHAPQPAWLSALGRIESTMLGRPQDGRARLRQAVRNDPTASDLWDALAAAHGDAHADALADVFALLPGLGAASPTPAHVHHVLGVIARTLEKAASPTLAATCRQMAAFVLDGTRPPAPSSARKPPRGALSRDVLLSTFPGDAPEKDLIAVADALAGSVHKVARGEEDARRLSGLATVPTRGGGALRAIADRVAATFGDPAFDLYEGATFLRAPAIMAGDPPAILLPSGFGDLADVDQVAGLARVFALHHLNLPFLDHLPRAEAEGLLFGALRLGNSSYGQGVLSPEGLRLADGYKFRLARVVGRKAKRTLGDLAQDSASYPQATTLFDHVQAISLAAAAAAAGDPTAALRVSTTAPFPVGEPLATALVADPVLLGFLRFLLSERGLRLLRAVGGDG